MSLKYSACGLLLLNLSACSTVMPDQPAFDHNILLPKMVSVAGPPSKTPDNSALTVVEPSSCKAFDDATTPTEGQRNTCITELMTTIDEAFQKYKIAVNNNIGGVNFSLDTLATVGSAAATASSGTTAKIMSAISSVASGSKTALSEDILYKATIQVLLTTMKGSRDKDAAAIKLSMQQSLAAYPMDVAKNDLMKYLDDGTLIEAFASLDQNANATAQACGAAKQAVSNAAKSGSLSASTAKIASAQASNAPASSTQTQCNQITTAVSFQWDASPTAATLFGVLVNTSGAVNPAAVAALRTCAGAVKAPPGFDVKKYKNPDGTIDVAQLAVDQAVSPAYKGQLLTCVQTALKSAPAT